MNLSKDAEIIIKFISERSCPDQFGLDANCRMTAPMGCNDCMREQLIKVIEKRLKILEVEN